MNQIQNPMKSPFHHCMRIQFPVSREFLGVWASRHQLIGKSARIETKTPLPLAHAIGDSWRWAMLRGAPVVGGVELTENGAQKWCLEIRGEYTYINIYTYIYIYIIIYMYIDRILEISHEVKYDEGWSHPGDSFQHYFSLYPWRLEVKKHMERLEAPLEPCFGKRHCWLKLGHQESMVLLPKTIWRKVRKQFR